MFLSPSEDLERLHSGSCDHSASCRKYADFRDEVAKRKTLFDDRPVEINELTYVIKQDLSSLNSQISSLQSLSKSQQTQTSRGGAEQEGEHNKNVCTSIGTGGAVCLPSFRS